MAETIGSEPDKPILRRLKEIIKGDRLKGTRRATFKNGGPLEGTPTKEPTVPAHHTMHEEPPPKPARTPKDIAAGRG